MEKKKVEMMTVLRHQCGRDLKRNYSEQDTSVRTVEVLTLESRVVSALLVVGRESLLFDKKLFTIYSTLCSHARLNARFFCALQHTVCAWLSCVHGRSTRTHIIAVSNARIARPTPKVSSFAPPSAILLRVHSQTTADRRKEEGAFPLPCAASPILAPAWSLRARGRANGAP